VRDQDSLVAHQQRGEPHTEVVVAVADEIVERVLPLGERADLILRVQHEVQLFAALGELCGEVAEPRR
jgi:hypothetical protein